MSKTPKAPDVHSAAVTARVISRLLKKNGFQMADTSDRFHWTEGIHVHRIGYGKVVSIDYHTPLGSLRNTEADRQLRREQKAKVRALLVEKGYTTIDPRTDTVYVNCEAE